MQKQTKEENNITKYFHLKEILLTFFLIFILARAVDGCQMKMN